MLSCRAMRAPLLPLVVLSATIGIACKPAAKIRETKESAKTSATPITGGAYQIRIPAGACWDVRSQEIGANRAPIQLPVPCHNSNYDVFEIWPASDGWYTIATAFPTNYWVMGPGQPG